MAKLPHREAWEREHGPIPKGYVVHVLNGNYEDLRDENLAAVPRNGPPQTITPPYRHRIQQLEKLLEQNNVK